MKIYLGFISGKHSRKWNRCEAFVETEEERDTHPIATVHLPTRCVVHKLDQITLQLLKIVAGKKGK